MYRLKLLAALLIASLYSDTALRSAPASSIRFIDGANRNGVLDLKSARQPVRISRAYRVIETLPATVASDVVIEGIDADDLQRGGIRLRGLLTNVVIRDSSFRFRQAPQERPNLPACIEAGDKRGSRILGLLIQNVVCEGFQMTPKQETYVNGDGPTIEANVTGLMLDNVTSRNSSDACFDIKPVARATRILAEGCKRNVRLWRGFDADQVTSISPVNRGGPDKGTHIWVKGNPRTPPVIHIRTLIIRSTSDAPIFTVTDGPADITVDRCVLDVPPGTKFKRGGHKMTRLTLGPGCTIESAPDDPSRQGDPSDDGSTMPRSPRS